jgi:hypothetical protein
MTFEQLCQGCTSTNPDFIIGGIIGALIVLLLILVIFFLISIYVYTSLAWMTIAKKLKYKRPLIAWIPIANIAMILQMGGFHWAWIFLILIPILGWIPLFILVIIANWRIFEKRKYPGWYSLSLILPEIGGILYMIALGFIAWKRK